MLMTGQILARFNHTIKTLHQVIADICCSCSGDSKVIVEYHFYRLSQLHSVQGILHVDYHSVAFLFSLLDESLG